VVDPTKFDFYATDCYRHLAEDRIWVKTQAWLNRWPNDALLRARPI
jgi:hypothetical protein